MYSSSTLQEYSPRILFSKQLLYQGIFIIYLHWRDHKENMKHVKGARQLADIAARDNAHMIRAYRV